MYKSLLLIAAVVCAVSGQADRYPAGLNPALCPNYPNCDNALIALYSRQGHALPAPVAAAPGYPAGVSPAACPNYPFCSVGHIGARALPLPGFAERLYPSGVSAAACPNYPYCN